jgi:sugar lactone lactonase YvrE
MIETAREDGRVLAVLIWRSNPALIGADGITFDGAGNLWVATNLRNSIHAITPDKDIIEVSVNNNVGPLEFPTSLVFSGDTLYVTNTDIGLGENESRGPGVGPSIAKIEVGVSGLRIPR